MWGERSPKGGEVPRIYLGFALISVALSVVLLAAAPQPAEAPVGLGNVTNGLTSQATYDADVAKFSQVEGPADGVGPIFNDVSCANCHQDAGTVGAGSQNKELRVGYFRNDQFVNPDITLPSGEVVHGRSLVDLRSICPEAHETAPEDVNVQAFRLSLPVLGDGYIEAIPDSVILAFRDHQCQASGGRICGLAIQVPISEAPGQTGVGRFGSKAQQRSLLSFSADAYLNEMGVTTPLQPAEAALTCNTASVPNDSDNGDLTMFTEFMRSTTAPGPDPLLLARTQAQAGAKVFQRIGCAFCHFPNWQTAASGTSINGGQFTVPDALANKSFHPYSDFLLHDVGTGDGIVQNGGDASRTRVRTPPLWGLRIRTVFMHDGNSVNLSEAIRRHRGEAADSSRNFQQLSAQDQAWLFAFLRSL
jgi:CxxC motif-containing protein (DUF1111 family)